MHPTRHTPIAAQIFQLVLTSIFILSGDFKTLISFFGIIYWFWYLFTVLALFSLRIREPDLPRPYKTWLITPVLFSVVAVFLLFMPVVSNPLMALAAAGFISCGLPAYWITRKLQDGSGKAEAMVPSTLAPSASRSFLPSYCMHELLNIYYH